MADCENVAATSSANFINIRAGLPVTIKGKPSCPMTESEFSKMRPWQSLFDT